MNSDSYAIFPASSRSPREPDRTRSPRSRKGQPDPVVGEGEVDWPAIFRICEGPGGTEWYIIEDESRDHVMQRVKTDVQNLRKLLAQYHG